MRVVSQNRDFSVNFEGTAFWTQGSCIYAMIGIDSRVMGKYEQNVRQVFEEMHLSYARGEKLFYMPEE